MNVDNIATNSFQGKFIRSGYFNSKEERMIRRFINYEYNGITNAKFLKKKNYDVFIKKSEEDIILESKYKIPFLKEPENCYISSLDFQNLEGKTVAFRASLNWFEDYKKKHNGYNSFFEKIVAYSKEILN